MSVWSKVGSVFSKLGKNAAFTTSLAAIGTGLTTALIAKIDPVAKAKQEAAVAEAKAAAARAAGVSTEDVVKVAQQIPWGPVVLLAAVGFLGFYLMRRGKGARGGK